VQRKANHRIDSRVGILLKIARGKAFEHFIKVEKNSVSEKVDEINKQHM